MHCKISTTELRTGCTDEVGRDVTDSPFIPRDSTPSAPPPEEEPLDAEINNSSQGTLYTAQNHVHAQTVYLQQLILFIKLKILS